MQDMNRDVFEFILRYFHISYDRNSMSDVAEVDDVEDNGDDGHVDVGENEEEGDGNDASNNCDAYNCVLEEFEQNTIGDADANIEVEEKINVKGVALAIIVEVWCEKVSEWIEFVNDQSKFFNVF